MAHLKKKILPLSGSISLSLSLSLSNPQTHKPYFWSKLIKLNLAKLGNDIVILFAKLLSITNCFDGPPATLFTQQKIQILEHKIK